VEGKKRLTKGQRTKREILNVAKRLFLSQGYTATSMRQIAQAAGITPAAIYIHFQGKEEIFTTLLGEAAPFEIIKNLFETIVAQNTEILIEDTLLRLIDVLFGHEDYLRLALIDVQERNSASIVTYLPEIFPVGLAYHQRLQSFEKGESWLRDLSPFLFMRALMSLISGYILTDYVIRSVTTVQLPEIDWIGGLVDIFLHGVLKPPEIGVR
jgi:AcrR family transcriptional regulator